MLNSPVKKIFITQKFGVNPDSYKQWGLKGHNGIDYRAFLPNGNRAYSGGVSEVFAPHSGKIIENALDAKGYGWYIKIENDKYGSVLAHFSHQSPLKVGSSVKIGQFVGYQGKTGNSTGIHLHWGFYKHPRNRANGYAGFINQEGLYKSYGSNQEGEQNMDYQKMYDEARKDRDSWWNAGVKIIKEILGSASIGNDPNKVDYMPKRIDESIAKYHRVVKERNDARGERDNYEKEVKSLGVQIELLKKDKQDQSVQIKSLQENIAILNNELENCSQEIPGQEDLEQNCEELIGEIKKMTPSGGKRVVKKKDGSLVEVSYKVK